MNAWKLAVAAAAVAAVAFVAKAVVIASAGLGQSGAEDGFFVGQVAMIVGAASLGVWVTSGRSTGMRALGAVAAVLALAAVTAVVALLVSTVTTAAAGWVWGELNLWVGAGVLLAAVTAVRRPAATLA